MDKMKYRKLTDKHEIMYLDDDCEHFIIRDICSKKYFGFCINIVGG
ncbi:unnamed protein product [marine sediment metagenome]|uniref:Uncharacterized protein n=1 Tax=marine sediment metagenome TaxID=412755 RepID=X0X4V9_9ZZZZ